MSDDRFCILVTWSQNCTTVFDRRALADVDVDN